MGDGSKIEWTDATWNPVRARHKETLRIGWHCEHVSEGCRHCYAERQNLAPRGPFSGTHLAYKPAHRADIDIFLDERVLEQPLRWRRRRLVFPGSMTDLFADFVPDAMLDRIFAVMALCPQHTFQILTKRPQRMRAYVADPASHARIVEWVLKLSDNRTIARLPWGWPLPNVWLGTSCEDQTTADARVPDLLATPAAARFVSAEPLLGPICFDVFPRKPSDTDLALSGWERVEALWGDALTGQRGVLMKNGDVLEAPGDLGPKIDWIIVGGESGPHARPMHPAWARSIRDQCAAAGVSFHFKQRGAWSWLQDSDGEWPVDADGFIRMREDGTRCADGWPFQRVGKKRAGRLLDGVTHDAMPEAAHAG